MYLITECTTGKYPIYVYCKNCSRPTTRTGYNWAIAQSNFQKQVENAKKIFVLAQLKKLQSFFPLEIISWLRL